MQHTKSIRRKNKFTVKQSRATTDEEQVHEPSSELELRKKKRLSIQIIYQISNITYIHTIKIQYARDECLAPSVSEFLYTADGRATTHKHMLAHSYVCVRTATNVKSHDLSKPTTTMDINHWSRTTTTTALIYSRRPVTEAVVVLHLCVCAYEPNQTKPKRIEEIEKKKTKSTTKKLYTSIVAVKSYHSFDSKIVLRLRTSKLSISKNICRSVPLSKSCNNILCLHLSVIYIFFFSILLLLSFFFPFLSFIRSIAAVRFFFIEICP